MAQETDCSTPGAIFSTHIDPKTIVLEVDLPFTLVLTEAQAVQLERNLHNAVELALAPLFIVDLSYLTLSTKPY